LKALGKRLVGELLGETEYVAATLDPAFEVVMHSGGTTVTLPGNVIAEGVAEQTLTSTPVGLFLRFSGDRMTSEVAFMGTPETADLSTQEMRSVDALRAALTSS
jgi:hypothetical protein